MRDQRLDIVEQRGCDVNIEDALLQLAKAVGSGNGLKRFYQVAPVDPAQ